MIAWGYALVGDVVASRKEPDRAELGRRIEAALARVNARHARAWIAPLETTRGLDEVSSLLRHPGAAFEVVAAVNVMLWPARFRFALAGGSIDVGDVGDHAADLDGPAFHRAADALARAREERRPLAVSLDALSPEVSRLLEETAHLHHAHLRAATARGIEIMRHARGLLTDGPPPTGREIAEVLDVSPSAVSQALTRSHHGEMVAAEEAITALLATLPDGDGGADGAGGDG